MTRPVNGDEGIPLIAIRRPTRSERQRGAAIVFVRRYRGAREAILASVCHEGWQQWGAPREALSANVALVEQWRNDEIPGFPPPREASG